MIEKIDWMKELQPPEKKRLSKNITDMTTTTITTTVTVCTKCGDMVFGPLENHECGIR